MYYPKSILDYVKKYDLDKLLLEKDFNKYTYNIYDTVNPKNNNPFNVDWFDLVYLHKKIITNKIINVIDIGLGHSTIIMADALSRNKVKYGSYVEKNIRKKNPFVVYSVDASKHWIKEFKLRKDYLKLKKHINLQHSSVYIGTFNDRICSYYSNFPNIAADLIYLDAPGMYDIKGSLDGSNFRNVERVPLAADILRIEYFLMPGTTIVVDGRFANARFLKNNFQRKWSYKEDMKNNFTEFKLIESHIGKYNKRQIDFSKK